MKLAILWQRFGPYHLARLRGAADVLMGSGVAEIIGVEIAGRDHYDWQREGNDCARFARETLFPDTPYDALKRSQIRSAVANILDRTDPGAVAINGWSADEAMAALAWCKKRDRQAILMSETHRPSGNPIKEFEKRRRVCKFDAAIVGGRRQADYLVQLGFSRDHIQLGYDAVDNAHFANPLPRLPNLPSRYFFANTRFLKRKNIDGLLRAFAGTGPAGHSTSLVISGSGEMERSWKALAADLSITDHVFWPGFLQYHELPAAYQHAHAFIHPAHQEAWGLVLNEAAAAGLPLIAGDTVGASAELIREGQNGFTIDSHDCSGLTRHMMELMEMPDFARLAMGQQSRDLAERFNVRRFGEGLAVCLGEPAAILCS